MKSSKGGKIEFYSEDKKVGEIDTWTDEPEIVEINLAGYDEIPDQTFEYDRADLVWVDVGELPVSLEPITIKTTGEINVVNLIAYVHKADWDRYRETTDQLIRDNKVVYWGELDQQEKESLFSNDIDSNVEFVRHEPTRYTLNVESETYPVYLVFSETFDEGWKVRRSADGKVISSVPVYTFLNGFVLRSGGEYELFFEPQKHILPGLVVTTAFLAGIVIVLVRRRGLINNE